MDHRTDRVRSLFRDWRQTLTQQLQTAEVYEDLLSRGTASAQQLQDLNVLVNANAEIAAELRAQIIEAVARDHDGELLPN